MIQPSNVRPKIVESWNYHRFYRKGHWFSYVMHKYLEFHDTYDAGVALIIDEIRGGGVAVC